MFDRFRRSPLDVRLLLGGELRAVSVANRRRRCDNETDARRTLYQGAEEAGGTTTSLPNLLVAVMLYATTVT